MTHPPDAHHHAGRLAGRTALITGASRGIGAAIAAAFAREGATVVLSSRKQAGLEAVAERLNAARPGCALPMACHMGRTGSIGPFVEQVVERVGVPDILVNNAATNPYFGPMLDLEWAAWRKTFEVNLEGPFELTRQVGKRLIDADRPGCVLFVSSIFGLRGAPGQGIYGMTKAALVSLTRTLALELGGHDIRVNALAPGLIETRFSQALTAIPEVVEAYHARAALGRHGQPEEVAGMAVTLASAESGFMTGQVLVLDGGYLLS